MKNSFHLGLISLIIISFVFFLSAGCGKKQDESKLQVTTNSNEARAAFVAGRDLFEKVRFSEAREYFEKAYTADEQFALAYLYHALANPTAKEFYYDLDKALKNSSKITKGERLMIMALQANVNGDQKLEEKYMLDLANLYPNDERVQSYMGQLYFNRQEFDKAIDYLTTASKIAPDYSPVYNSLGYTYLGQNNFRQAEKAFNNYIKLIPDDPNPYDSYAEMLLKEGRYEESIRQYRKALNIDPDFFSSYIGIAANYNFLDRYEDARKELQTMLYKANNDIDKRAALYAMAVSYIQEGKFDLALKEFQKRYNLSHEGNSLIDMSGDLDGMGNILVETGKYDDAMKKYEESLQMTLNTNLPDELKENARTTTLYQRAKINLLKNDIKNAVKLSDEFKAKAAKSNNNLLIWRSHELEGLIALHQKDYRKADTEFQKANQLDPYIQYYLGLVDQGLKDNLSASKHFDTALKFNAPNNINQAFIKVKKQKKVSV